MEIQLISFAVEADLDRVKEEWLKTSGQTQIKDIATHYGVYEHLFGYGFFMPRIPLNINVKTVHYALKFSLVPTSCLNSST